MTLQVQYGLNVRPKAAGEAAPAAEAAGNGASNTREWELAKFKADMERLPGVSSALQCTAPCKSPDTDSNSLGEGRVGQLSTPPAPTVLAKAAVAIAHHRTVSVHINKYICMMAYTAS